MSVRDKRTEERRKMDRFHRQLLHQTEIYGFYVRLYYLEEDDSFFLEWRLPDLSVGDKYFVNPDECFFSLKHCKEEIESHCARLNPSLPRNQLAQNPCALHKRVRRPANNEARL